MSIATPELGTRTLTYSHEIGLSDEQVGQVISSAHSWRVKYIAYLETIVNLGKEIDRELLQRHVDLTRVHDLREHRASVINTMESEFVEIWAQLREILTDEQNERLQRIYRREFSHIPHPVLGSSAKEYVPSL